MTEKSQSIVFTEIENILRKRETSVDSLDAIPKLVSEILKAAAQTSRPYLTVMEMMGLAERVYGVAIRDNSIRIALRSLINSGEVAFAGKITQSSISGSRVKIPTYQVVPKT